MPETMIRTLPNEDFAGAAEIALQAAFDLLEQVGWAAKVATETDFSEYPHRVTLEDLGVLALIRADLDNRIEDFQEIAARIDGAMFHLSAIRAEQESGNPRSAVRA